LVHTVVNLDKKVLICCVKPKELGVGLCQQRPVEHHVHIKIYVDLLVNVPIFVLHILVGHNNLRVLEGLLALAKVVDIFNREFVFLPLRYLLN
jgi:hypothetical protein